MGILLFIIIVRLFFLHQNYEEFLSKPFYFTHAEVLSESTRHKRGKSYKVLKLHSDEGLTFYTVSYKRDSLLHKRLRLQIFPNKKITFSDYMGTFFVKSHIKKVERLPQTLKDTLLERVLLQHKERLLGNFYNAVFFATPLDRELREKIGMLGVSHLVALSGFHLGILWGIIYGCLLLIYRPLQQRYFPYRYSLLDLGVVTLIVLALYLWFVNFPPSLLRSYAMLLIGWGVVIAGIELLSFFLLATILLILIALYPALLFSLGFWFSIFGVFYIFLLLTYTKAYPKWIITLLIIPFGIFILMLPVVHGIFGVTTTYQLYSPLFSLLFVPFYPLVMVLHLIGMGDLLDSGLLWLFSLPKEGREEILSLWILGGYGILSLASIWSRKIFFLTLGVALLYAGYLFV